MKNVRDHLKSIEFQPILIKSDWLAGPGKAALQAALASDDRPLSLR